MNLKQKLEAAIKAASDAIESGDLEKGRELRTEAERIGEQIKEMKSLSGLSEIEYEPVRPALPGIGAGALAQQAVPDDVKAVSSWTEGAYLQRFGAVEGTTKSILTDLHGSDYQDKYLKQKRAFRKYLSAGENALNGEDRRALSEVVMTPKAVKAALEDGIEDIAAIKTTLVEANDTMAGYFVPVDMQTRMIELLQGMTVIRGKASKISTSRDKVEFPTALDNNGDGTARYTSPVRVQWVDETPTSLASNSLSFGSISIPVHTSMVEAYMSRNLIEDSTMNFEDYLSRKLAEAAAIDEDDQFLLGNGVGRPEGILPGGTNKWGIPEVAIGGSSPYVSWNSLIDITYTTPRQYRSDAGFLARRTTYQTIRKLTDQNQNYLWQPFEFAGGQDGQPGRLLGYGFEESEGMPALAANAYAVLFGDLSAYQVVDRVGMTLERFGQQDSTLARRNLVSFIMRRRLGGKLLEPHRLVVGKCS